MRQEEKLGAALTGGGGEVSFGDAECEAPRKHAVRYFFVVEFHSWQLVSFYDA